MTSSVDNKSFLEKWNLIVKNTPTKLSWPKEIIQIIFDYTIISPRQQYSEKFSKPQTYKLSCRCYSRIMKGYETKKMTFDQVTILNKEKIEAGFVCPSCFWTKTWEPTVYQRIHCNNCAYCDNGEGDIKDNAMNTFVMLVNKEPFNQKKTLDFNACTGCGKIEFCSLANTQDKVCLVNHECKHCQQNVCLHALLDVNFHHLDLPNLPFSEIIDRAEFCIFCR